MTIRTLITLLLALSFASAREIVFHLIAPEKDCPREVYLVAPGYQQKVKLSTRRISPDYELPAGDLELRILAKLPEEGQEIPVDAPVIKVAAEVRRVAAILTPAPENTIVPVRAMVVDIANLKTGSTTFYNFTKQRVRVEYGEQEITLKPASYRTAEPITRTVKDIPVQIFASESVDHAPVKIASSYWANYPNHRQFTFVTHPPRRRHPTVNSVLDFEAPTPKKEDK